jgi:transposase
MSKRKWKCEKCEVSHDRDVNAAINLALLAVSSTVTACGEFYTAVLPDNYHARQVSSKKQEGNIKYGHSK